MKINKIKELIRKNKSFLITSHINPEGDAIGSQLAMYTLLLSLGKKAFVLGSDRPAKLYSFLPYVEKINTDLNNPPKWDVNVVLDCPVIERTGRVARLLHNDKPTINIDHHVSNTYFGDANWVNYKASSCGEMVYQLFHAFGRPIERETALLLYVAMLTDTGSFGYESTSAKTHLIVAELLEKGIRPVTIHNRIYESKSPKELKLLQKALGSLKIIHKGKIAYLYVTQKMLKEVSCGPGVTEGFINYPRSIVGVKVALLFLQGSQDSRKIQVSFRGKGEIDVNALASAFDGGGHRNAAGCVIRGTMKEAITKVLKVAKRKT